MKAKNNSNKNNTRQKMINKNIIIGMLSMLMLVLILSPAQAALVVNKVTDEFSFESPYPKDNVKACQCSTRTDTFEVKNIGDFTALFTIEIYSPYQELITLSDDTFELVPGEEKTIYAYIDVPCDTPLNTFYVARARTNYGRSKEIQKLLISKQCQNIKFISQILNPEKEEGILPGHTVHMQIDLQNVADFTDTFTIRPLQDQKYTTISQEQVTLAADQEATILLDITYSLKIHGEKNYAFIITSEKGRNQVMGQETFTIKPDYDYTIKTETFDIEACEEITKKAVITFENLAESTPNTYYVHLTGPGFAELSQNSLDLEPGEKDSITLNIKPEQADIGEYTLLLSTATEYGDVHKEKSFELIVRDCFDTSLSIQEQTGILQDKACCGQKTYNMNIRNNGEYEEAYEIIIDGPAWIKTRQEDQFVRLRPGQNKNIPLIADLPCADTKQTAFVMLKQLNAPYQTKEIRLELESLSKSSCYNIDMLQDKHTINYDTKSIPVLLQNTGLKGGTYKLELGELESRFVYLTQDTMDFEAGETKVLHLIPMNYTAYKQGTYLNKLSLSITPLIIPEDKDAQEITYHRQFWIVLRDKGFVAKAIDYLRNFNYSRIGWCGLISIILAAAAGITLLIVAYLRFKPGLNRIKRIKAKWMKTIRGLNIALIFLLILSILAIILIGNPNTDKFFEQPSQNQSLIQSKLYHEWKQNTPYTINLEQYFTDPDMDVLSYTPSQPNHIQISITDGIATLRPEHNWAGQEQIVFTANDEKGGTIDSPVMTLKVLEKKPVGILGFWNTYCKHINLVLLIILTLLLLLLFDLIEEKGYEYYLPNKYKKKNKFTGRSRSRPRKKK